MQPLFRASLSAALAAFALQTSVSIPAFAQPRQVPMPPQTAFVLPPAQIESIDANAKTVTMRHAQLAPGTTPIVTAQGATQVQVIAGEAETIPLAAHAVAVRIERALPADALKIGDIVTLLGQKTAPGQLQLQIGNAEPNVMQREALRIAAPPVLRGIANARYSSKVEGFRVISLNPLTLKKGANAPSTREDDVLSVPFTNGPGAPPIGTLSVGTAQMDIPLTLRVGAATKVTDLRKYRNLDGTLPTPAPDFVHVSANYVVTLRLARLNDLEFDRFSVLPLADVAADFAAGKVNVEPELGESLENKTVVNRLVVTSRN